MYFQEMMNQLTWQVALRALLDHGDTIVNSLGGILVCGLGFVLARRLGLRSTLALFVVMEVALVFLVRDSLLLIILMLVYPMNAVKAWQAAGH